MIQYRGVTDSQPSSQPASQPPNHVAVASTRYAYLRRAVETIYIYFIIPIIHYYCQINEQVQKKQLSCRVKTFPNARKRHNLDYDALRGSTTTSSADADNRLDAFSGQSRSTNIVPFHMLHIVSYGTIVTCL